MSHLQPSQFGPVKYMSHKELSQLSVTEYPGRVSDLEDEMHYQEKHYPHDSPHAASGGVSKYLGALEQSIQQHGIKEPLQLSYGVLHDGHHRAAVAHRLKLERIPYRELLPPR